MTIEITSNFGRFATKASTEVEFDSENNDQMVALLKSGLENELFRAGGSAGFKALVALKGDALPDDSGAVKPIDKKTPRSLIAYTPERAAALANAMNEAVNGEESELPEIVFEVTGEHVFGEKKESAMVRAKGFIATMKAVPGGLESIRETLAKVNPAAKECDEEELATIVHAAMFAGK